MDKNRPVVLKSRRFSDDNHVITNIFGAETSLQPAQRTYK